MAELGFDLAAFGDCGASALHLAAWFGHVEMVRLLIGYDVPVNIPDTVYRTSPLAWAAHGSTNSKSWRDDDHDYRAVISSLIDAGAE